MLLLAASLFPIRALISTRAFSTYPQINDSPKSSTSLCSTILSLLPVTIVCDFSFFIQFPSNMSTAVRNENAALYINYESFIFFHVRQSVAFEERFATIHVDVNKILPWPCSGFIVQCSVLVRLMTGKAAKRKQPIHKSMFLGNDDAFLSCEGARKTLLVLQASLAVHLYEKIRHPKCRIHHYVILWKEQRCTNPDC